MKRQIDKYQVSLKVFIKNEKDEVLALKASDTGTMAGYYDFPGGRIDAEEFRTPFTDIVAREIAEECGEVEFELGDRPVALGRHLIPADPEKNAPEIHVLYVFFEAGMQKVSVTVSDEHTGYRWFDLSNTELEKYFTSGNLEGAKMYLRR